MSISDLKWTLPGHNRTLTLQVASLGKQILRVVDAFGGVFREECEISSRAARPQNRQPQPGASPIRNQFVIAYGINYAERYCGVDDIRVFPMKPPSKALMAGALSFSE